MKKILLIALVFCLACGVSASCSGSGKGTDGGAVGVNVGKGKIQVEFNLNYEGAPEAPKPQTVKIGEKYGELPQPARPGFTFGGWYFDKQGEEEEIDADTLVKQLDSHPLFAQWGGTAIKLSYDLHGGKVNGQTAITGRSAVTGSKYSQAVGSITPDARYGYVFTGWYLNEELTGGKLDRSTIITTPGDHTLHAGWKRIKKSWDFENPVDKFDFSFSGEMIIAEHNGSNQLRVRNTGIGEYRQDLYMSFGGFVPKGTTIEFDFTLEGTNPEGYETGIWMMPTSNGMYNGNVQPGTRARWYDGYHQKFIFDEPGADGMDGLSFMLEFSRCAADWQNMTHPEYWQAMTLWFDNFKLTLPLPAPIVKGSYDFVEESGSEEAFDANLAVTGGTLKTVDNPDGGKRLEVKTDGIGNTVYVYLRRPTAVGKIVTFGVKFAGTPAVSQTNKVSATYYGASEAGARLGSVFGHTGSDGSYGAWSAGLAPRALSFTVPQACERLCLKLEFGDGNTTPEQLLTRTFYITYITVA